MKFEHFAINVTQPLEMAEWYVDNLGLKIVKQMEESPYMTFLADDSGMIMLEIYSNPKGAILDFEKQHPLVVHLAFVSENPTEDKEKLLAQGATEVSDDVLEDGSHLVMLRDPWGFSIQFCKRAFPMLKSAN
ncbi:VOC family protein [Belliella marina]|uniref:VOC family protein n=1 Tax=Belliella marina TaxID=1644146 RepID=A0ABW4VGD6_9BACT